MLCNINIESAFMFENPQKSWDNLFDVTQVKAQESSRI